MSLPSLADAPFLADPLVRQVLSILSADGEEARVIGGAVRNALLGQPVADVDIATTAVPDTVLARIAAAGLKAVPTGIEHGTVTVVGHHHAVEVTTLREDVETDGRRAVVAFGRDWTGDAHRRDFTMNALSVDVAGTLYDLVGGYPDLVARRVRFIGEADRRIAEDRLRVLRFFRFHAAYGEGALDPEGLSAAIRARHDLSALSAERIGQEMRKLVVAPGAPQTVRSMQEAGILPLVLAGVADLAAFERLAAIEAALGMAAVPPLRLAALAVRVAEDCHRIALRFRLSNHERDRIAAALEGARTVARSRGERALRAALYRLGPDTYRDGVVLAEARGWLAAGRLGADLALPERAPVPAFPVGGKDVVELGVGRGPAVGAILRDLEAWWIAEDFRPDAEVLRRRLQAMVAAQQ